MKMQLHGSGVIRTFILTLAVCGSAVQLPRGTQASPWSGAELKKMKDMRSMAFLGALPAPFAIGPLLRVKARSGGASPVSWNMAKKQHGQTSQNEVASKKNVKNSQPTGAFDLAAQRKKNEENHASQCSAMLKDFNATLPHELTRQTFEKSDFVSISVDKGLIGHDNNSPFGSSSLIHHSATPLFTKAECESVIEEAEAYAKARGGWSTQRHYSHPTTDILLQELPQSLQWFREVMPTKLFPMIAACFPNVVKDPELLRIFDVFVVKYDSEEQSYLSVHRDSSLISITVALNPSSEYEGGGMWVESLDKVVAVDQGMVATFASNIRHGGNKVTKGLRYILVGFCLYEGYVEHDRRFLEASYVSKAQGNTDLALRLCRECLSVNPRRQEAWNNLGCLQRDAGNHEEAIKSFKKSLEINDAYQEAWVNLGTCQGLSGDKEGAIKTERHAVSINGLDATAHYNLGCALDNVGRVEEAIDEWCEAIKLNSRDGDALHRRGQARLGKGQLSEAVDDLKRAANLLRKNAAVHNDLGVALYESNKADEALDSFLRALEIDPEDVQAASNAAALRKYLGRR